MKLSEKQLRKNIKDKGWQLKESIDISSGVQSLVREAMNAYQQNVKEYGNELVLMNKDGEVYGLNGEIKLLDNGYLIIPFSNPYTGNETEKIKVFVKTNRGTKFFYDELHYDYDWRDAKKFLSLIIKDAERYRKDMEGYDVNWEDENNPNPKAIRDFNKQIGVKADARKITESQLRNMIRKAIMEAMQQTISPQEYQELVDSAKEYYSGDIELWIEENVDDTELELLDENELWEIWLKAHPNDDEYYKK